MHAHERLQAAQPRLQVEDRAVLELRHQIPFDFAITLVDGCRPRASSGGGVPRRLYGRERRYPSHPPFDSLSPTEA